MIPATRELAAETIQSSSPVRPGLSSLRHVVILGGGFGGLYAAHALRKVPVRVTLVDQRNYHLFQPLLYQVATAALNPSDIAVPIRSILKNQKNARVILERAVSIDAQNKKVILTEGEINYDYLIVATGATHSYFEHPEWKHDAPGLKTVEDALEIRKRMLLAYEAAEREPDPQRRKEWLTFVIVGGGPTAVELAGALAEISRHTLSRDFRNIDPGSARIVLIGSNARLLPAFHPPLSEKAQRQLKALGVEVRTSCRVTSIDQHGVNVCETRINAGTVIWAGGVQASPVAKSLGVSLDPQGRIFIQSDLTIPNHPDIFVVGDLAALQQDGKPVPGVASAAVQEGRHAAKNICMALCGKPYQPFRYFNKGMMAVIGRGAAVADIGHIHLSGLIAWLAWLLVHVFFLLGFRNRFAVLFEWAWAYFTWERGSRLITHVAGESYEA